MFSTQPCRQIAIVSASCTKTVLFFALIDQPITLREYKSNITAKYIQPSLVAINVVSDTQTVLRVALNSRFNKSGEAFNVFLEFVVTTNLRDSLETTLAERIKRAVRFRLHLSPSAIRSW